MKLTTLAVLVIGCCSPLILAAQQTQGTLTNGRIEDMVLAGVSQSEIIRIISTASAFNFDLRPGSTDNLLKVGVSENIIKAMAAREIGAPIQAAVLSVQPVLVSPKPVEPPPVTPAVSTTAAVISRRVVTSSGVLHQGAP